MGKPEIAKRLAQQFRVSRGEAADRLDRVVNQILSDLRAQKSAPLPGLGKFVQRPDGSIRFEKDGEDQLQ
jgi:nucleoid DNA-binding protein